MSSLSSFLCSNTVSVRATPRSSLSRLASGKKTTHRRNRAPTASASSSPSYPARPWLLIPRQSCRASRTRHPALPHVRTPLSGTAPSTRAPCLASPPTMAEQRTSSGEIAGSWSSTGRESGKASFRLLRSATLFLSGKAISCLCPL